MRVSYSEGVANHADPESWLGGREAAGQALTGEGAGGVSSRESFASGCRRRSPGRKAASDAPPSRGAPGPREVIDPTRAPNTSVTLVYDETITAEFVYRPGIDTLDFAEAFSEFLVEIGHNQTPVLYDLSVDTGEFDYDSGAPAPNGIPDAAELAVLQQVLQDPEAEYGYEGGISHALMWDAYLENVAQADTDLAGLPEDVITTAAAYMTLGDWEHQEAMAQWLEDSFSVTVDTADYANEGGALFWADGDLDADGTSNQAEWDAAYAAAGGNAAAAVQAYAANAASQAQTDGATPWNAPPISDQDWQAALDEACWTPEVTVNSAEHLAVTARAFAPGRGGARDIPVGQAVAVPLGSKLSVKAAPKPWFHHWWAENTLIHGSNRASEKVIVTGDRTVTAVERAPVGFFLDNTGVGTLSYELTGRDPLVLSSEVLENGNVSLVARSGTLLAVTAHPYGDITPGLREPWGNGAYSCSGHARIDGSAAIEVFNAGTAYQGYGAVTVRGSNGLGRASGRDYGSDGILDQALYHIPLPDANGNWTQYADWYFLPYVGFYIHCWSGPTVYGGDGNVAFYFQLANPDQDHPNPVYRAVVRRKKEIEWDATCRGGCTEPFHGGVIAEPAKKYYTPDTEFTDQGEVVRLTASPACGHFFAYWDIALDIPVYVEPHSGYAEGPPFSVEDLDLVNPDEFGRYYKGTIFVEITRDVCLDVKFWDCMHCGEASNGGGTATVGSLIGATELPGGTGYYRTSAGDDYYGCKYYIIHKIETIGESWAQSHPNGPRVGITSISIQLGGYSGHNSHQNGLDVDVRYVKKNGAEGSFNFDTDDKDLLYDGPATQDLVDAFVAEGATDVFADERAELNGVQEISGHQHHFHVRFADPDGEPPTHCPVWQLDCQ